MPTIDVSVPHRLSQEAATARIKNLIGDLRSRFGDQVRNLREQWNENSGEFSFEAMGFKVSGSLNVSGSDLHVVAQLPFAALPFKSRIENTIRERAAALLS